MPRCAFLSLDDASDFVIDDDLAIAPLADCGWEVETISWRDPSVARRRYDAVVIRSTWDYVAAPDDFLTTLATIEKAGIPLFNCLDLVRWNISKTYLRALARRGVSVVPTWWRDSLEASELDSLVREIDAEEIIIKPVIGLNAGGVFRLSRTSLEKQSPGICVHYAARAAMAQPFLPNVLTEGEFSLIYFNGELSHAILKTPKVGDFRVQEEHGGIIRRVDPSANLRKAGRSAVGALDVVPLYARADFVRANDGAGFYLMELELIEPSLYLRMDTEAPARFARAFQTAVGNNRNIR